MLYVKAVAAGALLLGLSAHAQGQSNRGTFDPRAGSNSDGTFASLVGRGDVRYVTNGGQSPSSEDQFDEIQWRGALDVNAAINRDLWFFVSDYTFLDRRFSEQGNQDGQVVLGRSALQVGKSNKPLFFNLEHSSQEMSLRPGLPDVPNNRDRRTILTAGLNSTLRMVQGNYLHLWAEYTDISLRYDFRNEAEKTGAGIDYTRLVSTLYQAGVSLSAYRLDYQYVPEDFDNQRAYVWWKANLRRLDYSVQFGIDRINLDAGTSEQTPYVDLNASYDGGAQVWGAGFTQFLTDTSQGSLNNEFFNSDVGQDGVKREVDQFERRELEVSWLHRRPCRGCSARFSVGLETESYLQLTQFDSEEAFTRFSFDYQMSRLLDVDVFASYNRIGFPNQNSENAVFSDFNQFRAELGLSFNVLRAGALRTYIGNISRDYDSGSRDGFSSQYIGLTFSYDLYQYDRGRRAGISNQDRSRNP